MKREKTRRAQQVEQPQFRRRALRALPAVLAVFYLSFNAISGERGLYGWFKARRELDSLQAQLTDIKTEQAAYDGKIKRLHAQSLDLDMLDEQARKVLGYVRPDEIVVTDAGENK